MADPQHAPGTFSWFECGSRNASASKSFYTQLFDWTAEDKPMPGDMGGHYTMFRLGGEDVAGLYELVGPMAEIPPHWATYVTVANVDETVSKADIVQESPTTTRLRRDDDPPMPTSQPAVCEIN